MILVGFGVTHWDFVWFFGGVVVVWWGRWRGFRGLRAGRVWWVVCGKDGVVWICAWRVFAARYDAAVQGLGFWFVIAGGDGVG